jgi:hypothetical protein
MSKFIAFYQNENCILELATSKAFKVLTALAEHADFSSDYMLIQQATQQWLLKFQAMNNRDHEVYFQLHEELLYRLYQFQQSGLINMIQGFRWLQGENDQMKKQEAIDIQAYWQLRYDGLQEIWKKDALKRLENATCKDIIPKIIQFID